MLETIEYEGKVYTKILDTNNDLDFCSICDLRHPCSKHVTITNDVLCNDGYNYHYEKVKL